MENDTTTHHSASPLLPLSIGFLVGGIVVGACWLSAISGGPPQQDVVRNVTVDYMYETSPGSASGNTDLAVDSIEFLPGYVVMTDTHGRTQLLALNRLRRFSYQPTKK